MKFTLDLSKFHPFYKDCAPIPSFESAFFNTKPHAAVRDEKVQRSDHPLHHLQNRHSGMEQWVHRTNSQYAQAGGHA